MDEKREESILLIKTRKARETVGESGWYLRMWKESVGSRKTEATQKDGKGSRNCALRNLRY